MEIETVTSKEIYSPLKILKHLDSWLAKKPVYAQIDLTNACNHNCIRCSEKYHAGFESKAKLSEEMVKSFLDEFVMLGGKAVEWTGGGEPLASPVFLSMARYALELGLQCGLVTNGTLMAEKHLGVLEKFEYVRVSVDAFSDQVYQELRQIKGTLIHVPRIAKWLGGKVVLGASLVIQPENIAEIVPFTKWIQKLNYDNVRLSFAWTPNGADALRAYRNQIKDAVRAAKEMSTESFRVFVQEERLEDVWKPRAYSECYYSDLVIVLGANGKLYHCCTLKNVPGAEWGDLHDESFVHWWLKRNSPNAQACPPCWMDKKNEAMGYMLTSSPKHVNFV